MISMDFDPNLGHFSWRNHARHVDPTKPRMFTAGRSQAPLRKADQRGAAEWSRFESGHFTMDISAEFTTYRNRNSAKPTDWLWLGGDLAQTN